MATDLDLFEPLPLTLHPQTKVVSLTTNAAPQPPNLPLELTRLNALQKSFKDLDPAQTAPPPPLPVKPNRSQNIAKLRESANAALKKAQNPSTSPEAARSAETEAIKYFDLALAMAGQRPPWEPAGLLREELGSLYSLRAGACVVMRRYADGLVDARLSLECKKVGNPGAYVRGAKCLSEMGRVGEAREWAERGLEGEVAALEQAKAQLAGMGAAGPQVNQAKEAVRGVERDVEELREVARGLGVVIS